MIRTRGLTKTYKTRGESVKALELDGFDLPKGSFSAIIGSSGSGKSTLLNILGLLDRPDSGEYLLDGADVSQMTRRGLTKARAETVGFVFQSFNLIPGLTALENVELGLTFRGIPKARRESLALAALESVGLANRSSHHPSQMSGGQQQRTAIARAIAGGPGLILADEPTGNLDGEAAGTVMDLLEEQHRNGVTLLVITHSPAVAARAERVFCLKNGTIVP